MQQQEEGPDNLITLSDQNSLTNTNLQALQGRSSKPKNLGQIVFKLLKHTEREKATFFLDNKFIPSHLCT